MLLNPLGLLATFAAALYLFSNTLGVAAKLPTKEELYVNGKTVPVISRRLGDIGPTWAGAIPVSSNPAETKKIWFWLFPPANGAPSDYLTIFFAGGPGCSGLASALRDVGPFLSVVNANRSDTTIRFTTNPHSWTKSGWLMVVDQPILTGLSQGSATIKDQIGLATQFYGFLSNFYKVFPEKRKLGLAFNGVSYAGQYIPWIADYFFEQPDNLGLDRIGIIDGRFLEDIWEVNIPSYQFAVDHQKDLGLSEAVMKKLKGFADKQGLTDYLAKTLVYPPKGPILPPKGYKVEDDPIFSTIIEEVDKVNDCFNFYNVKDNCENSPYGFDPLTGSEDDIFINRNDFKEALHADVNKSWRDCIRPDVLFLGGTDQSPFSMTPRGPFGTVVDKAKKTVIVHGLDDYKLVAAGTALGIQNTTFGGLQGFQKPPTAQLKYQGKVAGNYQVERKLTFVTVRDSGHFVTEQQPGVALKLQRYLLGQITEEELSK